MRRKIKNKKRTISLTLEPELLSLIDENFTNRSKFIQKIMIEVLCKNKKFKEKLKKLKIIL